MPLILRSAWFRYCAAIASVALATWARLALDPTLGDRFPFVAFVIAIIFSAWYTGFGPSLLALVLSFASAAYFFFTPRSSLAVAGLDGQVGLALYAISAIAIVLFAEVMRAAQRRIEATAAQLRVSQEELRQQRDWFNTTLSSIGDGVIATDPQGRVTFLNAIAEALTGWQAGEAKGQPLGVIFKIINEETRGPVESPVEKVLATGAIAGLANHTILVAKDGTERCIDDSAAPIRDNTGKIVGVVLIFRDISERRRAERQFQAMFDLAAVGQAQADPVTGRFLRVNRRLCEITGYSAEELLAKTFRDITHPEDQRRDNQQYARLVSGEIDHWSIEKRYIRKDGTVIWVEVCGTILRGDGDHPARTTAVVQDITSRKRSEEELRTLANSIPQLAWMARPDGHIFWYNKRWYDYTGTTPEDMEGWGWQSVHDPAELPRVLERWKAAIANGQPWEDTFPLRRHDGAMRWHLSRAVPVTDEQGRIVRWFGTNTDITDQMETEEALKESDRHKDNFLAMLGHELRNPLAGIVNGVQVLRMLGGGTQDAEEMREVIERQANLMSQLIDDLLDVTRISRGKIQLRKQRIDLVELVRKTVESHRLQLESDRLALAHHLPPDPLWVDADPTRLAQVVGNLLHNARKFTDPGGQVTVSVSADPEGQSVAISVRDTGIGLEPHMLSRVFEAFNQADGSVGRSRGGLGLGLALVKGLVEIHGGGVTACSLGLGYGSEFRITLPLSQEGAPLEPPVQEKRLLEKRHRILLIDDRRDAIAPLEKMLCLLGQEVATAESGEAGLRKAKEFCPEIVLCDIGLPDLSGHDVAKALRTDPNTAFAYLVAITGYGQEEDRRRAVEAGFDYHVAKPVSKEQLEALLAQQPRFRISLG